MLSWSLSQYFFFILSTVLWQDTEQNGDEQDEHIAEHSGDEQDKHVAEHSGDGQDKHIAEHNGDESQEEGEGIVVDADSTDGAVLVNGSEGDEEWGTNTPSA